MARTDKGIVEAEAEAVVRALTRQARAGDLDAAALVRLLAPRALRRALLDRPHTAVADPGT